MVLHSASRLGVLSYLFKSKDDIAYSIGLLSERPITSCSHDFYFADRLTIVENESDRSAARLPVATEIQLFFVPELKLTDSEFAVQSVAPSIRPITFFPEGSENPVFRPPIFS